MYIDDDGSLPEGRFILNENIIIIIIYLVFGTKCLGTTYLKPAIDSVM